MRNEELWISVEDRLPSDRENVLVWYKYEQLPYESNVSVKQFKASVGLHKIITHWMPLPKPPEDK